MFISFKISTRQLYPGISEKRETTVGLLSRKELSAGHRDGLALLEGQQELGEVATTNKQFRVLGCSCHPGQKNEGNPPPIADRVAPKYWDRGWRQATAELYHDLPILLGAVTEIKNTTFSSHLQNLTWIHWQKSHPEPWRQRSLGNVISIILVPYNREHRRMWEWMLTAIEQNIDHIAMYFS